MKSPNKKVKEKKAPSTDISHCVYHSCQQLFTTLKCAANTWVRRQELWESPCFCSTIWNHSQPITNSFFLAAQRIPPLSLCLSFHHCWQWNCSRHSALINNLQRKTTKLVNWHTQSTLTVRLALILFSTRWALGESL